MATADDIKKAVDEYRTNLKKDVDDASKVIEEAGYVDGGGAFSEERFVDAADELYNDAQGVVNQQKSDYNSYINSRDRSFEIPTGTLNTAEFEYPTSVTYDTTSFSTPIVPTSDKNLNGFQHETLPPFTAPIWSHGQITQADIRAIQNLGVTADAQLKKVQEGWELLQFDIDDAMDLAGARLGAQGFRSSNSWLKRQHLDIIRKASDTYHTSSKAVANETLTRLRDNIQETINLLTKYDSLAMEYNAGLADGYSAIAKVFYATKGITNSLAIEAWKIGKSEALDLAELALTNSLAILKGFASIQSQIFRAKYSYVMGEWDAEMSRLQKELEAETASSAMDLNTQQKIMELVSSKVATYYAGTKAMVALDKSQFSDKILALKSIFKENVDMMKSSGAASLGVISGKG